MPDQSCQLAAVLPTCRSFRNDRFTDIVRYAKLMDKGGSIKLLGLMQVIMETNNPLDEKHNNIWMK